MFASARFCRKGYVWAGWWWEGAAESLSHSSVLWMLPMDAQVDMLPLDEPLSPGGKGVLEQDDEEKGPLT